MLEFVLVVAFRVTWLKMPDIKKKGWKEESPGYEQKSDDNNLVGSNFSDNKGELGGIPKFYL